MSIPISDCHTHTNPVKGLGMKVIAKKFRDAGGWFLGIVSIPPSHYGLEPTIDGYRKAYDLIVRESESARDIGLEVRSFIGIHPADIDKLLARIGIEKTAMLVDRVLELVEDYIKRGLVNGLGEFGKPHYKTVPEAFSLCEYVTIKALEIARDYQVPVHLHLEQKGIATTRSLTIITKLVGISKDLVIVHHADTRTSISCSQHGYPHTVLGKYELLRSVLSSIPTAEMTLVESDHIDDPKRPGVAMYPWDIAISIDKLREDGFDEEILHRILVDNVVKLFGAKPP